MVRDDSYRTLVFLDILGFAARTLTDRRRVLTTTTKDYEVSLTSRMANQANLFCSIVEQMLNRERLNGRVQGMLFSDCAFIDFGTPFQAAKISAELMRILIFNQLPVRIGIGRGTFYPEQCATNLIGSSLVAKAVFFGTGVINAYQAEQCGAKGMRILVHPTAVRTLTKHASLNLLRLPKKEKSVQFELSYLTDRRSAPYDKDETLFNQVAAIYPKAAPLRVRRQYIDTFKALNRMRTSHNRPVLRYQSLPGYKAPLSGLGKLACDLSAR